MSKPLPGLDVPIVTLQTGITTQTWYEYFSQLFKGLGTGLTSSGGSLAVSLSKITASLGADTAISNSVYSDGPSIAQGTAGTWWVSATVTYWDTAGAATFGVKLWDGTTLIATARCVSTGANLVGAVAMSGYLASPAGNLRISMTSNAVGATSAFRFNATGNSKDCTISAIRIG